MIAFTYEALDAGGRSVRGTLEAGSPEEASRELRGRRLFVTRLTGEGPRSAKDDARSPRPEGRGSAAGSASRAAGDDSELVIVDSGATSGAQATAHRPSAGRLRRGRAGSTRELLWFTQQMTMLLRAGSRVVPAVEAIVAQIDKPAWRAVLLDVQQRVATGSSLAAAMAAHPQVFPVSWRAVITAGEATGQLSDAFARIAQMAAQTQQVRSRLIGALAYPAVLMVISVGVLGVLMFFVLPRFDDLYTMLNTPLPTLTRGMLTVSRWLSSHPILVVLLLAGGVGAPAWLSRHPAVRARLSSAWLRLPLVGPLTGRLILARILRVWGTSIQSDVPLMDSLELARQATRQPQYRLMLDNLMTTVSEGATIGAVLAASPLVPRTMAAAVATGEQSGRLGEALLFLADFLDEENTQSLATLTRLIEPVILVLMGLTVGTVAISLFLPLFDLTSATG